MADSTVEDAIADVARFMGMVNSQNMTPYSDDACIMYLKRAHNFIKDQSEWDEMLLWRTRTLDGTTGKITELITDTLDWKDVLRVYHESMQTPLAKLSSYVNPLTSTLLFGYRGLDPASDNTASAGKYLVQFYPETLTGQVLFQIRRGIDWTSRDTVLPIDYDWHVYLAAHMWACQDGTNPVQISNLSDLLRTRKDQIMSKENSRPLQAQPNQLIPNDWWEADAPYS
jgi:hypothetical protein